MTKYSPLTDREEAQQLIAECESAVAAGYDNLWDFREAEKVKGQSIVKHINALALTGLQMRRKRREQNLPEMIDIPDVEDVPYSEWLSSLDFEQVFDLMPGLRADINMANPAYRAPVFVSVIDYCNRLLETLPEIS